MLEQCPHCHSKVLYITDTCPQCKTDRNAPAGLVAQAKGPEVLQKVEQPQQHEKGTLPRQGPDENDKPKATDMLWGFGGIALGLVCAVRLSDGNARLHTVLGMIVGFGAGMRYLYRGFGKNGANR